MLRDSEDADAPRRVLYHGQHISQRAVEQADFEKSRAGIASA